MRNRWAALCRSLFVALGVELVYTGGVTLTNLSDIDQTHLFWFGGGMLGPIPVPVVFALIIGLLLYFLLKRTTFGRAVSGAANIRELNRSQGWELPTDGPKTLNGLIVEMLETIPEPSTCLKISGYPLEIVAADDNRVRTVRMRDRIANTES